MKYTKKRVDVSFFLDGKGYTTYYKDGVEIAHKTDGEPIRWIRRSDPVVITRSQAYRYWFKHFPRRCCFDLPELLAYATIHLDNVDTDMVDGVWFDGHECCLHYC